MIELCVYKLLHQFKAQCPLKLERCLPHSCFELK